MLLYRTSAGSGASYIYLLSVRLTAHSALHVSVCSPHFFTATMNQRSNGKQLPTSSPSSPASTFHTG